MSTTDFDTGWCFPFWIPWGVPLRLVPDVYERKTIRNISIVQKRCYLRNQQPYMDYIRPRSPMIDSRVAVVVEGYTDVIACHQAGFRHVIATLGPRLHGSCLCPWAVV